MRLQFGTSGAAASGITPTALEPNQSTGRKAAAAENAGSSDSISLSSTSNIINRDAVSRSSRVQQLSLAVQGGTYRVSNQALSTSIVSAALGQ